MLNPLKLSVLAIVGSVALGLSVAFNFFEDIRASKMMEARLVRAMLVHKCMNNGGFKLMCIRATYPTSSGTVQDVAEFSTWMESEEAAAYLREQYILK